MTTSSSVAVTCLNQLIVEIQQKQIPKTLAYWRLNNPQIVQALHDFASKKEDKEETTNDVSALLDDVLTLFRDQLNPLLAEQESEYKDAFVGVSTGGASDGGGQANKIDYCQNEVSVVFGGKYPTAGNKPASISETLVSKLVTHSRHVITVSRSDFEVAALPPNVTHISKQNLDSDDTTGVGVEEYKNVMNFARYKLNSLAAATDTEQQGGIAFYLTLGQHKGINPFQRNIQGAINFCQALQQTMTANQQSSLPSWRVVVTGTDATLPSTYPDGIVTINDEELVIPSYKIMKYNYVYAMSKLGQYYLVVNTVANLLDQELIVEETAPIIDKIQKHVSSAGDDGDYHPDRALIQMEELDTISKRIMELCNDPIIASRLWIATGISICYTPLHAHPWTDATIATDSPRSHIIEQIVRRLKNAISIEKAASLHFPPHPNSN